MKHRYRYDPVKPGEESLRRSPSFVKTGKTMQRRKTSSPPLIEGYLDKLEKLADKRVNPIRSSAWNYYDSRFQYQMLLLQGAGVDVTRYERRYDAAFEKLVPRSPNSDFGKPNIYYLYYKK